MIGGQGRHFVLPGKLEVLLASLAERYRSQGEDALLKVVVNSRCEVDEGVAYDNWDGGMDGHAIRLHVPAALYGIVLEDTNRLESELQQDLNRVASYPGEYIESVHLSLAPEAATGAWRKRSGVLMEFGPALEKASSSDLDRLWELDLLRIFLSHKAEYKAQTTKIKDELRLYGASSFVAHEDIEPTKEWMGEIERALESMEIMVVLLTQGIKESCWSNQEIGIAIGRGVPILSVRLGEDPFGFVGKYQALGIRGDGSDQIARTLFSFLMTNAETRDRSRTAFVRAWEKIKSFTQATKMMSVLDELRGPSLPEATLSRLKTAYERNGQIHGCNGLPRRFLSFVERMGGQ